MGTVPGKEPWVSIVGCQNLGGIRRRSRQVLHHHEPPELSSKKQVPQRDDMVPLGVRQPRLPASHDKLGIVPPELVDSRIVGHVSFSFPSLRTPAFPSRASVLSRVILGVSHLGTESWSVVKILLCLSSESNRRVCAPWVTSDMCQTPLVKDATRASTCRSSLSGTAKVVVLTSWVA